MNKWCIWCGVDDPWGGYGGAYLYDWEECCECDGEACQPSCLAEHMKDSHPVSEKNVRLTA